MLHDSFPDWLCDDDNPRNLDRYKGYSAAQKLAGCIFPDNMLKFLLHIFLTEGFQKLMQALLILTNLCFLCIDRIKTDPQANKLKL